MSGRLLGRMASNPSLEGIEAIVFPSPSGITASPDGALLRRDGGPLANHRSTSAWVQAPGLMSWSRSQTRRSMARATAWRAWSTEAVGWRARRARRRRNTHQVANVAASFRSSALSILNRPGFDGGRV
jgi:hypothetical protein